MSNLLSQITPLTKGILWLSIDVSPANNHYREIDYLLDGLLTASLVENKGAKSQLIVGENFGKSFYVMIVSEQKENELLSFLQLIKKDLGPESNLVVIDEKACLEGIKPTLKDLIPYFKVI